MTLRFRTLFIFLCFKSANSVEHYDNPDYPQATHDVDVNRGRRLAPANFLSVENRYKDANLSHTVAGIRVTFVWDLVEDGVGENDFGGPMDRGQCRTEGATVNPYAVGYSGGTCPAVDPVRNKICTDRDVVTKAMVDVAKGHAEWTRTYLESFLMVTTVTDPIIFTDSTAKRCYDWEAGAYFNKTGGTPHFVYNNTDLVVVMNMHKSQDGVAGYASCGQRDDSQRCVVGYFNWSPAQVDVENAESPDVVQSDRSTFLHEVLHVLGCCSGNYFINEDGSPKAKPYINALYDTDVPTYKKTVRFINSPKVLKTVREQWDCPSAQGAPLEDLPLGAGSHWESRVLGPEVMSYGSGSGEIYLSDFTLAYLEDSGHFVVKRKYRAGVDQFTPGNEYITDYTYDAGGRLMEATGEGWEKGTLSKIAEFFGLDKGTQEDSVNITRSKGYVRWGRSQGCAFFEGLPKNEWSWDNYLCADAQKYGCTADNRMSAKCSIKDWKGYVNSPYYSCVNSNCANGLVPSGGAGTADRQSYTNANGAGDLPEEFQNLPLSASEGGYNDAMDYVPVKVGYWNCLDTQPTATTSRKTAGNASLDFNGLFDVLSNDLNKFGGQQHGAGARCFKSTLREIGSPMLSFDTYGLCYVSNCYKTDYLQVGVRSRDGGTEWYGCPPKGGLLYLAGFTGALHCPEAEEFCRQEDISGVYYNETEIWFAWVIVGAIMFIPLSMLIVFCCWPKAKRKAVLATKLFCGFELDPDEKLSRETHLARKRVGKKLNRAIDPSNTERQLASISSRTLQVFKFKVTRAMKRRRRCETRMLFYINAIWTLIGLCTMVVGFLAASDGISGMKHSAPFFIGISLVITLVASLGCSGIETGRPSIKLLLYFYVSVFSLILCAMGIGAFFLFRDYWTAKMDNQWYTYRIYLPEKYQEKDRQEAIDALEEDAGGKTNSMVLVYGSMSFTFASIIGGAVCSAYVLSFKNLMQNLFMVLNMLFVFSFGVLSIWSGVLVHKTEAFPEWIPAVQLCGSIALILIAITGVVSEWMQSRAKLFVYEISATALALFCLGSGLSILVSKDKLRDHVDGLDVDSKARVADAIGQTGGSTPEELTDYIVASLMLYGIALLIIGLILVSLVFLSRYVIGLHKARKKLLSKWAKDCKKAEDNGGRRPIAPDLSFANLSRVGSLMNNQGAAHDEDLEQGIRESLQPQGGEHKQHHRDEQHHRNSVEMVNVCGVEYSVADMPPPPPDGLYPMSPSQRHVAPPMADLPLAPVVDVHSI